jgi:hypothetical protein
MRSPIGIRRQIGRGAGAGIGYGGTQPIPGCAASSPRSSGAPTPSAAGGVAGGTACASTDGLGGVPSSSGPLVSGGT